MIRLAKGSTNWLLARFAEQDGDAVTSSNPASTTTTVTLTDPAGATVVNAQSMTWDAAFVALDENGTSRTGWWKYIAAAAAFASKGRYRMTATGTGGGTTRVFVRIVQVTED